MLSAEPLQQGCQIRRQTPWSQRRRRHMKGKLLSSASMQVLARSRKGRSDVRSHKNSTDCCNNVQCMPLLIVIAIGSDGTKSAHAICNRCTPERNRIQSLTTLFSEGDRQAVRCREVYFMHCCQTSSKLSKVQLLTVRECVVW